MTHPVWENLEVYSGAQNSGVIRCTTCSHIFCEEGSDWRLAAERRLSPPTEAGPLMRDLMGHYMLERLLCPSCGVLLNTDLVPHEPVNSHD
jgi:acetone carboxylase gamma subunit